MRWVSADGWALIAIAAAVVLANLAYLAGPFDPNPLASYSGLSAVKHGILGGQPTLDSNSGLVSQALGHRAALDLLHLRMPWWNPYEGTGAPLAGEMQSAAFFPLTLLTAISNGQLYEHMLLELIAGCSTYLLLRRLGLRRVASTGGGIAFALNGTFAWFMHAPVNPIPFLPMLLLGVELAYAAARAGRRGGWWLIAVAGALSVYAGFPEVAYIDALLAVLWTAWRASSVRGGELKAFAAKAAAGAIVAALLSAPVAVPFIDYLNHAYAWAHGSGQLAGVRLTHLSLAQLLFPYIYGSLLSGQLGGLQLFIWDEGGYLSTLLAMLAVFGLCSPGRRGLRVVMAAWIVLVISRTYGVASALGDALGVVPGMSRVLFARYAFPSLELAVIVLAALGLDALGSAKVSQRRLLLSVVASLVLVALVIHDAADAHLRWYFPIAIGWGVAAVLAAGAIALVLPARARIVSVAALVALEALALFLVPELSAPRSVHVDLAPVAFLRRHLGDRRFFTTGPLAPNYGTYFGISSLNAMDVPVPSLFRQYVRARLDPGANATAFTGAWNPFRPRSLPPAQQELLINLAGYRAAGVTYVLTAPGTQLPQSNTGFRLVLKSPSAWIYHLPGARPYFSATSDGCRVNSTDRASARLSCPTQTTLIRLETDLPGWSATVDGRPAPIHTENGTFQSITVPAGSHRVNFEFAPPNIGWAFAAFAIGCAWLLTGGAARRIAPRRSRSRRATESLTARPRGPRRPHS